MAEKRKRRTLAERQAEKGINVSKPTETNNMVKDTPAPDTHEEVSDNPLLQEVIERDYAKANFRVVGGIIPDSVPSPRLERPTIDLSENQDGGASINAGNNGSQRPIENEQESERGSVHNPAYDSMKPKAQKESARKMARTIVDAYANLNNVVRDHIVKTDMNKLQMKAVKGEFDMDALNVELPVSESETVTVGDVILGTNASADEIFTCSEDFNEETEELWTDILKEKGLGMSPIQRLTWLYVEDMGKKGIAAWGLYKTNKEILNTAMQILAQVKPQTQPRSTEYVPHNEPAPTPAPEVVNEEPATKKTKKEKVVVEEVREAGEGNVANEKVEVVS
jgi:hypothetical protein